MKRSARAASALFCGVLFPRAAQAVDAPVELPPFVVEDAAPLKWHYAETPEYQILSQCDDAATRELAERFHHLRTLFDAILSPDLQMKSDVPATLVLYDEATLMNGAAAARGAFRQATLSWLDSINGDTHSDLTFRGSMGLYDDERASVVLSIPHRAAPEMLTQGFAGDASRAVRRPEAVADWSDLTPGYVSHLVAEGEPPLPAWFVAGFLSLFGRVEFDRAMVTAQPLEWLSKKDSLAIARTEMKTVFLPLPELFADHRLGYARAGLWLCESDLFIRWALTQGDRSALWTFVNRSRFEPVTEALFTECFHANFETVENQVRAYLPKAVQATATIAMIRTSPLGRFPIRPASRVEIARIKGGFEMLEASCIRPEYPELYEDYLTTARHSLHHAYDAGDRDPAVVAELALCELDLGNVADARPLIESAVQLNAVMPRVYFELARLRYAELLNQTDRLTPAQVASVLEPLEAGIRQNPRISETYELVADVWIHTAATPAADDVACLEQGMQLFPKKFEVRFKTAQAFLLHGFVKRGHQLAEAGAKDAPNEAFRDRFAALRVGSLAVPR